jgi:hypothetical protein
MRRLARAVAGGDPEAAEAFLFKTAQNGTWFLSPDWKGDPNVTARRINENRAYWVRLLGYLRWPGAADLHQTVATQAPARVEREHEYWWGERKGEKYMQLSPAEPMHELGQIKPFSKIGIKIADGIGAPVMEAIALAGVEFTFGLSTVPPATFGRAKMIIRELEKAREIFRSAKPPVDVEDNQPWKRYKAVATPLERELWDIRNTGKTGFDRSWRGTAVAAELEAGKAFGEFFSASNRHDAPKNYSRSLRHATLAVAWKCESDRGTEGRPLKQWHDPHRPARACNTVANKLIKRTIAPAAVVAIANQIMRYS